MLALDVNDPVHVVVDDGYDGDGVIQSLEVPDLRALIAFVGEVRPRGTVTNAEHREAVHRAVRVVIESVRSGDADRDMVRAVADQVLALEAGS